MFCAMPTESIPRCAYGRTRRHKAGAYNRGDRFLRSSAERVLGAMAGAVPPAVQTGQLLFRIPEIRFSRPRFPDLCP